MNNHGVFKEPGENLLYTDRLYGFTRSFTIMYTDSGEYSLVTVYEHQACEENIYTYIIFQELLESIPLQAAFSDRSMYNLISHSALSKFYVFLFRMPFTLVRTKQ